MSEADVDVVRQIVAAFRDRDVPRLRELFHDDAEFRSAIVALEGGTYRGREEMERYMNNLDAVFEDWHSEDEEFVDGGDGRVALVFRIVGRGRGSGAPVNQPIAIVWTVRDGKAVAAQGYLDREEALSHVR
jgi:ketosteroid isomerase-like protein